MVFVHLFPPTGATCSAWVTAFPARGVAISLRSAEAAGRPTMATADQQRPETWRLRFSGLAPGGKLVDFDGDLMVDFNDDIYGFIYTYIYIYIHMYGL